MKQRATLLVCLFVLLAAGISFGQNIIKGMIEDAGGKPVPGITVSIPKWGYETVTGTDGLFVIPYVEGSVAIDCSAAHVPKWCWPKSRYSKILTKDHCKQGWGEIRLRGILLSQHGEEKWLFKSDTCEFIDNMDGTVTDCQTGLMWAAMSPMDSMGVTSCWTWDGAKGYCDELELAGFTDWELPSLAQLATLPYYAIHGGPFDTVEPWWSSELTGTDKAWTLKRGTRSQQNRLCHNTVLPVRSVGE